MAEKIYKLRYLPLFEEDLFEIIDYITCQLKNLQAANNLIYKIETAIMARLKIPKALNHIPL
jgi:toxin ParE1/3/4